MHITVKVNVYLFIITMKVYLYNSLYIYIYKLVKKCINILDILWVMASKETLILTIYAIIMDKISSYFQIKKIIQEEFVFL